MAQVLNFEKFTTVITARTYFIDNSIIGTLLIENHLEFDFKPDFESSVITFDNREVDGCVQSAEYRLIIGKFISFAKLKFYWNIIFNRMSGVLKVELILLSMRVQKL